MNAHAILIVAAATLTALVLNSYIHVDRYLA